MSMGASHRLLAQMPRYQPPLPVSGSVLVRVADRPGPPSAQPQCPACRTRRTPLCILYEGRVIRTCTERKDENVCISGEGEPTCVVTLQSVRTHNNTWRSKRGGIHHGVWVVFVDLRAGGCGRRLLSLGRSVVARCSAPDLAGDQPDRSLSPVPPPLPLGR